VNSYQRPANRVDPNRVNAIWKKLQIFCKFTEEEIIEAMAARGINISKSRIAAWSRSESSDKFSPMTLSELDQVLDAMIASERQPPADQI
jgi:uncharacterized protein YehS (DUF1456 family)